MSSDSSSALLVRNTILAGIVGAVLALLLAPRTGKESRHKLQEIGNKLRPGTDSKTHTTEKYLSNSADQTTSLQDQLRIKLENRRQTPILTNWEQEL